MDNAIGLGRDGVSGGGRRRVAVVVDSAASAPAEFGADARTFVVPMALRVGDDWFRDGADITAAEFYGMMRENPDAAVGTSAPSAGDFLDAFRAAAAVCESIACIVVSDSFSSTMKSAEIAAKQFSDERGGFAVRVVDSWSAAGGEGLVAWEALKAARGGAGLDEVVARAKHVRERVRLLACVDTLRYLRRGGRVSAAASLAASVLDVKPIFELRRSRAAAVAKPRTGRRAVARMVRLMAERLGEDGGGRHARGAAVMRTAAADERAAALRAAVEDAFECDELFESEFTPVMGAHVGPGVVGVAFWADSE